MPTDHEQIVQRGFDAFETADMDAQRLGTSLAAARRTAGV
jgi:hypothetical protein